MLFQQGPFRLRTLVVASLIAVVPIGAMLPARAQAQACDIPLTAAYERVANQGCGVNSGFTVGDWNADGRPDLVTDGCYDSYPSPIHIFLGSVSGIIPGPDVPPSATPIGQYIRAIDLNQDGKLDLIAGGNPPVVWYGHGDGTFDAPTPVRGLASGLTWIWTVDLNGDHQLDIVSLVKNPDLPYDLFDHVRTFLADGSGGFNEGPTLVLPNEAYQLFLRADDLNGDGRGDVVVVIGSQDEPRTDALIYLGDGTGAFQAPTTLHTAIGSPLDHLEDVLDWNGDGKLDIAMGVGSQLGLYFGHGDGTFSDPVTTDDAVPRYSGNRDVMFGDINGDSTPDAVDAEGYGFRVRLGSSDGHVGAPRAYPDLPSSAGFAIVQAIGDPAPDLVMVRDQQFLIYENLNGSFEKLPLANLPPGDNIRGADLNGDGRTDFVIQKLRPDGDSFLVELVTPALTVSQTQEILIAPPPGMPPGPFQDYQLIDITGDGIRDLLDLRNVDRTHDILSVIVGLPGGIFGARFDRSFEHIAGERPFAMLVGDLNRDGFRDILLVPVVEPDLPSADQMAGITFMAGHGDGTVDAPVEIFRSFGLYPAALRDVNGDGTPDLLSYESTAPYYSSHERAFTVRLANGDGTFGAPTGVPVLPTSNSAIASLRLGDVNGDGHTDAVILRTVPPDDKDRFRAHVFLGHGDGTFSGPVTSTADSVISAVFFLGDLNADGRADLIVEEGFPTVLRLFCGQPDGTFLAGGRIGTVSGFLFPTDMDGDGGTDIAAAGVGPSGGGIAFIRNRLVSLEVVVASITLDPPVIQPKSHGPWVHVTLELGPGHGVSEIDMGSLRILGAMPVEKSARIGDADSDGIQDLTVAFPREPFNQLAPGEHEVTLTGYLMDGLSIEAKATIRVLETHGRMAVRVVSALGASPVVFEVSNAVEKHRTMRVFDVTGRLVRAWEERGALDRRVTWDGRTSLGANAPSGVYFTRVSTPSGEATVRTVLLR